jgi:hypothetical protein
MNSFHPDGPPDDAFDTSLLDRYPPHGFPPYLGVGLLDQATLRLESGLSVAEYRQDDDLVYRVTGTYDPKNGAEGSSACGVANAEWTIEEFWNDEVWRHTSGYRTLPQTFFHHIASQLPTENHRFRELFKRLTLEFEVAFRVRGPTTHVMFPAGYVYVVRLPITEANLEGCNRFIESVAAEPDTGIPAPSVSDPGSIAVIRLNAAGDVEVERGNATDITIAAIRLPEILERLDECGADTGPIHLRPEVLYFNERAWNFSQMHPGKISRNILSYMVVPVGRKTPPVDELVDRFAEDSLELYKLVRDALDAPPPPSKPEATAADNEEAP